MSFSIAHEGFLLIVSFSWTVIVVEEGKKQTAQK